MTFTLGIVGGSGLYVMDGLQDVREVNVDTPYGAPSDTLVTGRLGDTKLVFLSRHGRGHRLAPHEINYRANLCALKKLGVTHLISVSAVGSMKEAIEPGHLVVVDQYIDLTKKRASTFFDQGIVGHVPFSDPVCPDLGAALARAVDAAGGTVHRGGTYVCIEGPQFSTLAESLLYRRDGCDVIGMTNLPEARLAREAELPYASLAMVTDYDCWHPAEESVDVASVLAVMKRNGEQAIETLRALAATLPDPAVSPASRALENAIITPRSAISDEARRDLGAILARHLG